MRVRTSNIAWWDGASSHAVGDGVPGSVRSLVVWNGPLVAVVLGPS
jgi:hypothetical protein